ncbi:nicotinate phosphoribosyltransferase [Thioalkalicoccus limnaeus]|uniref:Nicotinate phosphoribosyltransferase n=1 Tax=Thioalkalicoccus limnaeus TaxID=120681 RepID=A0ABV4BG19_9GAMM
MIDITGTYTDQYQLAMAQAYFLSGRGRESARFDYFFRKLPFGGGYAVFAGLEDLLTVLERLRFDEADLGFLREQGMDPAFVESLRGFAFRGRVLAVREGDLVFPTCPVVTVEASLIEAQIVETLLLNILNFQTLVATKASRMRLAAGNEATLVDFGLRRAPGLGGYAASRAAIVGGFDATSNVRAGRDYGIPVSGTMAHSFIQAHDQELAAFRAFAAAHPTNCVLLVDTYDTLHSGVPNAIRVGQEMRQRGQRLRGIRLDSGDLAYLSKQARNMLDAAGLTETKIAASNQLDEYVIRSLREQGAPIDLFGVGTSLATGQPDGALDGVYKLAEVEGRPCLKLSESTDKITVPCAKQVFRVLDETGGFWGADAIAMADETDVERMHHPSDPHQSLVLVGRPQEPLLHPVMAQGRRRHEPASLTEIKRYSQERLARLPAEYKRFEYPHLYKVGLSTRLDQERNRLIAAHRSEPSS